MNIALETYPLEGCNILLPSKINQMETESRCKMQSES